MFIDLEDNYDIISYFKLDRPINDNNFKYLKKIFTNKKNNEKIEKLLMILNQADFSHYNDIFLQYFSFYDDISFIKKIFGVNVNLCTYRFISIIIDKNIDIISSLLDYYNINKIKFYLKSDKDYNNNFIKIINKLDNNNLSFISEEILFKLVSNNYDFIKNLNFNILYLISKKDNEGYIFYKIINIYKKEDIKEPFLLLFNCLQKYINFNFGHSKNIIYLSKIFTKEELHLNHLKLKYNILFLEYIKVLSDI